MWQSGAKEGREFPTGRDARLLPIREAWSVYEPVAFKSGSVGSKTPTVTIPYEGAGSPFQFAHIGAGTVTPFFQLNLKYPATRVLPGGSCNATLNGDEPFELRGKRASRVHDSSRGVDDLLARLCAE